MDHIRARSGRSAAGHPPEVLRELDPAVLQEVHRLLRDELARGWIPSRADLTAVVQLVLARRRHAAGEAPAGLVAERDRDAPA